MDAKGVQFRVDVDRTTTRAIRGDAARIQQIIGNVLSNAVKFTPQGGRVVLAMRYAGRWLEIEVRDTGEGMSPDFIPFAFDRFRQADATTTRRYTGLGLGLSIVKHLTELHGGNVQVASQGPGRGATFTVSLPLQPVRHEPEADAETRRNAALDKGAIEVDLGGVKVLVIDDEKDSVETIKRILERHGAEVRGTYSMEEGLREFTQFAPNVVLSDIGMPEHDGYELIARLRKLPGGRTVPAVALTALARSEDRTRALRAGFQLHVAKPVDFTELIAVVQNLAALRDR
jgi:CheY-like chemotaxis protein